MSELNVSFRPSLNKPVLVAAFRGWNDGGQGASLGAAYLAKQWNAARFAEIDPETFFDFQAVRPHVSVLDGEIRKVDWPDNGFFHASIPGADRDAVLLLGVEPNLRWRTFLGLVLELARDLGVEMLVTFGSLLADVPHTRPAPVTAAATDPKLVAELGLEASRYEGPTGIVGIVHDLCRESEIPSVSLWAAVPHYVSLAPSPRAALSLVRRFGELMHVPIDLTELETAAEEYAEQVSEAVSTDADTAAYVEELEQRVDALAPEGDLPSGESLAAELSRFLREREEEGNSGPEGPAVSDSTGGASVGGLRPAPATLWCGRRRLLLVPLGRRRSGGCRRLTDGDLLRRLRRRRELDGCFGAGRFSESASATSSTEPSCSRASSSTFVARGV